MNRFVRKKMRIIIIIMLLPLLTVINCSYRQKYSEPASRLTQEDNIKETIFRYFFQKTKVFTIPSARCVCFLCMGDNKEPSDDFMKRLNEYKPWVKKNSQCTISEQTGEVIDNETGETGLLF